MHELSLAENVLQMIEETARTDGFLRVRKIILEIGQLAAVDPAAMRFCFDAVVRGSLAENAILEIVEVPGIGWCSDCQVMVSIDDAIAACPLCGGCRVQARGGRELRLKALEVE